MSRGTAPLRLQLLGPVTLRRTDGGAAPLVTQPRPLAVLAYLVLARPRGLHSRDTLLALLWPDATQESGRHALRNALHALRTALGPGVITSAGELLVGVDDAAIDCDVLEMERRLSAPEPGELPREPGELLQGFHVSGAPDFEQWLDGERARFSAALRSAAQDRSAALRIEGDLPGAVAAARLAVAIAPHDEAAARWLLQVLAEQGDRPGALTAYRELAARLQEEYGVEPSRETRGIVEQLRSYEPAAPADALPTIAEKVAAGAPIPRRRPRALAWLGAAGLVLVAGGAAFAMTRDAPRAAAIPPSYALRVPERYRADTALLQRYLRADALLERERTVAARESLQLIVDAAPLYAPAWAGLSSALSLSAYEDMPPRVALPQAVAAARRALSLDATLVEAHATLIANDLAGAWDFPAARARLDSLLAVHPDDPLLTVLLGSWHRWRGDLDEAVRLNQRAVALEPLSPRFAKWASGNLYAAHRCAEAADILRRGAVEVRDRPQVQIMLYRAYRCLGRYDEASLALRDFLLASGDTALSALLAPPLTTERRDSALRVIARARLARYFRARSAAWRPAFPAVQLYAELGDADSVLMWLDSMYAERAMALHRVPFDPALDFLRGDPRLQAFLLRAPWVQPPEGPGSELYDASRK